MKDELTNKRKGRWTIFLFAMLAGALFAVNAQAFVLHVVDPDGNQVYGFRWLVEEDTTSVTAPGVPVRVSISTDIHNSYAPVVAKGQKPGHSVRIDTDVNGSPLDSNNRYIVSVLPYDGYSSGGTVVEAPNPNHVYVTVHPLPVPTAQISVLAFQDVNPINNLYDEHDEPIGGARIIIADIGGQVLGDVFGNPLGTRYAFDEVTGEPILVDGNPTVIQMGTGDIRTLTQEQFDAGGDANPYNINVGEALIKYLAPGKYGIRVVPPPFDDNNTPITWTQTNTIEGTPTIDAWVKSNEPRTFVEGFGAGFQHVRTGFIKVAPLTPSTLDGSTYHPLEWNAEPPDATGTITGTVRMNHFSRPPTLQGNFPGIPPVNGWVALNDPLVQPGAAQEAGLPPVFAGKIAVQCDENGYFEIHNVPPGDYQLVLWDGPLDYLFGFQNVTVPAGPAGTGGSVDLGTVLQFYWFGRLENYVFSDTNGNGFRDPGEAGIPEQNVNIRFRDGTIYQAFPTDTEGYVPFDEVFPFFKWLVVEVDFARFKATGMTTAVDYGGEIPGEFWPADGNKNPQPQDPDDPFNEYGTNDYRTETGPVLTQAMHLFLSQTNLIEWGKTAYDAANSENGGISGIVFYAVTRAENDPALAAAETWEPGIPRVQVNLYEDKVINESGSPGSDGIIDDLDEDGNVTLADVDNYPFEWAGTANPPGPEDVDHNSNGVFDFGDAIDIGTTDSWDDNKPSGCIQDLPNFGLGPINECADSFGTWNQMRPGVFDGGYAFGPEIDCPGGICPDWVNQSIYDPTIGHMEPGNYIVEAVPPPGYELLKEEDRNVDFGDAYEPSPLILPPPCVGDMRTVPDFMSFDGVSPAPFAGQNRPLCDRKQVTLSTGQNSAADFFFFTHVPKAARAVGFVNNDLGAEFNQASPIYGEKLAAAWIPVSFRDWTGHELARVYTDEFGGYNAMLPSTFTINIPTPSGVAPNMITAVLNDPILADGITPDPYYDPDYAISPWTLQYLPGSTTYLDTPIIPVTAFAASDIRLDTGPADLTPVIYSVTTEDEAGPLICTNTTDLPSTVTINAPPGGTITIRNPEYPALSLDPLVTRRVHFRNNQGTVTLDGDALPVVSWNREQIVATVPPGSTTGRIMVTLGNNTNAEVGVTLNIKDCSVFTVHRVSPGGLGSSPIQDAVDAADAGDLILVEAGAYNENVIMYKPVRIQGSGYGTFIHANPIPLERLQIWHDRVNDLGALDFVAYLLKDPFTASETPGFIVFGETVYPNGNLQNELPGTNVLNPFNTFTLPGQAAIDGFRITGSKAGGGIFALASAVGLEISNNEIVNNQGSYAGGITIGTPDVGFDSNNDFIHIHHNKIHRNGGTQGAGGIALNEAAENYLVEGNLIIGNLSRFNGAGIAHRGLSLGDNVIRGNRIIFNEVFFGALLANAGDGGGIYIGGDVAGGTGSGSVTIDGNLIQGNQSGAGYGGGIRAFTVSGADVADANDANWYTLNIFNNMIVNNVAGLAGGGISLQDVARSNIINNTIAHNDSTATSALAFQAGQANSTPRGAGIVSGQHSDLLLGLFAVAGEQGYSNPLLVNNIIWQNRSFFNDASLNGGAGGLAENPAGPYWDLHVQGSTTAADPHLNPDYSIISSVADPVTGFHYRLGGADTSVFQANPRFMTSYFNVLESATVADEGGNAINVRFTPLTVSAGNYHINNGRAVDNGLNVYLAIFPELLVDFDGEPRPAVGGLLPDYADMGADESSFERIRSTP